MNTCQNELCSAIAAAEKASVFTHNIRSSGQVWDDAFKKGKEPSSKEPFTQADLGSQAIIISALRARFPEHRIIAEESSEALAILQGDMVKHICTLLTAQLNRLLTPDELADLLDWRGNESSEYIWTIDPIDGTKGYIAGLHYAVAIALLKNGKPILGAIGAPHEGELYWAASEHGAWKGPLRKSATNTSFDTPDDILGDMGTRITVSDISAPEHATMLGSRAHPDPLNEDVFKTLDIKNRIGCDSQVKYTMIADGRAEIYLRPDKSRVSLIWDHAPGAVILQEAGGEVTDITGRKLDFSRGSGLSANKGILATNGKLHGPVLKAVEKKMTGTDDDR